MRRSGFTLIELLVVVAILAIIAGAIIAAYDGLEEKVAQGVATYDLGALNSTIRTFRVTNGGQYPDEFDSLLFSAAGDGTDSTILNVLPTKLQGKLGLHPLTADEAAALNEVGLTRTRFVSGAAGYDNASTQPEIPNRVFDNPTRGWGAEVPLADTVVVASIPDSERLEDIAGLDPSLSHVVVAFGIGNNSTLVHGPKVNDARTASLAEAPLYQNILPNEYGRYIALFHLGTEGTTFEKARFLSVIDTKGDWYDEELAEYQGTKD